MLTPHNCEEAAQLQMNVYFCYKYDFYLSL